jgi:hypothetical protein
VAQVVERLLCQYEIQTLAPPKEKKRKKKKK